jgi:hypothetical protein
MPFPSEGLFSESIPGYTFLELQEEVLSHQFAPNKYRDLVKRWLNQAQRRLVLESEIRTEEEAEEITTIAGEATYTLPSLFARFIDLFDSETHEPLGALDLRDYDALPPSSGRPSSYTAISGNLSLYPTPDAVYSLTLRFWRLPEDMEADSDYPEVPAAYQELLIAWAMKRAYQRENDWQEATSWEAQWEKGVLKARGEVQHDMFDGPRQVTGSWEDLNQAEVLQRPSGG